MDCCVQVLFFCLFVSNKQGEQGENYFGKCSQWKCLIKWGAGKGVSCTKAPGHHQAASFVTIRLPPLSRLTQWSAPEGARVLLGQCCWRLAISASILDFCSFSRAGAHPVCSLWFESQLRSWSLTSIASVDRKGESIGGEINPSAHQ